MIIQIDNNIALSENDTELLKGVRRERLGGLLRRLIFSVVIPFAFSYLAVCLSSDRLVAPEGTGDVVVFVRETAVTFFFVFIALGVWLLFYFFRKVLPVVNDLKNNVKDQIIFNPQPYHVSGTPQFFMKTGIPSLPFIEISYNAFCNMNGTEMMVLEVAPSSEMHLGIKSLMDIMDSPAGIPGMY